MKNAFCESSAKPVACALYRHFDADGQLLYVGITSDLQSRTSHHKATSAWFDKVARTTTVCFDTREAALAAEAAAITKEKPLHNRDHAYRGEVGTVAEIISRWPTRRDLHADCKAVKPDVDLYAIHRWYQRGSINAHFWRAMLDGAKARGISLTADELIDAHAYREEATA